MIARCVLVHISGIRESTPSAAQGVLAVLPGARSASNPTQAKVHCHFYPRFPTRLYLVAWILLPSWGNPVRPSLYRQLQRVFLPRLVVSPCRITSPQPQWHQFSFFFWGELVLSLGSSSSWGRASFFSSSWGLPLLAHGELPTHTPHLSGGDFSLLALMAKQWHAFIFPGSIPCPGDHPLSMTVVLWLLPSMVAPPMHLHLWRRLLV
jgi:hypothetical protein